MIRIQTNALRTDCILSASAFQSQTGLFNGTVYTAYSDCIATTHSVAMQSLYAAYKTTFVQTPLSAKPDR